MLLLWETSAGLQETCFLALSLKPLDSGRNMRYELVHQYLQIGFLNEFNYKSNCGGRIVFLF